MEGQKQFAGGTHPVIGSNGEVCASSRFARCRAAHDVNLAVRGVGDAPHGLKSDDSRSVYMSKCVAFVIYSGRGR